MNISRAYSRAIQIGLSRGVSKSILKSRDCREEASNSKECTYGEKYPKAYQLVLTSELAKETLREKYISTRRRVARKHFSSRMKSECELCVEAARGSLCVCVSMSVCVYESLSVCVCIYKSLVLIFQLPRYSAYYSCTTTLPVLIFQLARYSALPSRQFSSSSSPDTLCTQVVLPSRQFSSSSSPDTPRTQVVLPSRQFSSSSSPATPRLRLLKLYYDVPSSHLPAPQVLRVLKFYYKVASCHLPAPQLLRVLQLYYKVASSHLPARQILRALQSYYHVASSHLPAPQILRVLKVVLPSPQFSSSSSPDTPRTQVALASRQFSPSSSPATRAHGTSRALACFRALDPHGLRRGLRASGTNRTLACISRTRPARSPQRVARAWGKSHSRMHFAHSTRMGQIALSPAFRALDPHDLRRGLRVHRINRTLTCTLRTRHARSPQRVARGPDKSHSHLVFAPSTRTISAEGCARTGQIALSPSFRALDPHDLRRGRAPRTNRTLACISRPRHARLPQRAPFSVDAVRPTLRL